MDVMVLKIVKKFGVLYYIHAGVEMSDDEGPCFKIFTCEMHV